jgi:hypothetical protein
MPASFPVQRPDGSTSVGARFEVVVREERAALDAHAARWMSSFGVDPLDALQALPFVEPVHGSLVEVVFEGRADNRLWKDALVAFRSGVPDDAGTFLGFRDRVADRMHPASALTS